MLVSALPPAQIKLVTRNLIGTAVAAMREHPHAKKPRPHPSLRSRDRDGASPVGVLGGCRAKGGTRASPPESVAREPTAGRDRAQ